MVERFGGGKPWSQGGTELQSVVTNANEAAGRRHQPACLFLPVRDMKEGDCSKMEVCESVERKRGRWESCHIDWQKIARNGLASQHYQLGTKWILAVQIMLHSSNTLYKCPTVISHGSGR